MEVRKRTANARDRTGSLVEITAISLQPVGQDFSVKV